MREDSAFGEDVHPEYWTEAALPLESVGDADAAAWLVDGVRSRRRGETAVGNVVPANFEAYARIYHPAWRVDVRRTPLRWSQIAQQHVDTIGQVWWQDLQPKCREYIERVLGSSTATERAPEGDDFIPNDVRIEPPLEGSITPKMGEALRSILASHTSVPESCWFAVWEPYFEALPNTATIAIAGVDYKLFRGPLVEVEQAFLADVSATRNYTANYAWPESREWCLHMGIDATSTYVGARRSVITDVLSAFALEAVPVGIEYLTIPPPLSVRSRPQRHAWFGFLDRLYNSVLKRGA